jgi:hypothetical protein
MLCMQILPLVLIILLCAGAAAGIIIYSVHMHENPPDNPENHEGILLSSFSKSSGGDMLGGHYYLTLTVNESGAVEISEEYQEAHNTKPVLRSAAGNAGLAADIEKIIKDNRMYTWKNLRKTGIYALDAATTTYAFTYNGERITIEDDSVLPKGGWEALREITRLITDCLP